jgi:hypothetical protein
MNSILSKWSTTHRCNEEVEEGKRRDRRQDPQDVEVVLPGHR